MEPIDVAVIGGGPAGLAAALSASENGAGTLVIERENRLGGILKQCIHDGFGLVRFKQKLSGPEYADRYIKMVREKGIPVSTSTFVHSVKKSDDGFLITLVNSKEGMFSINSKALVLANGCRERTSRQIFIHGTRPSGIYTAGTVQYLVNIQGYLPCKRCVILGSGDIGLIMARRLTLEGARVLGVYEAKSAPSGLGRNIAQCLEDFSIPLYLSCTITRVFGEDSVEAVEVCEVDGNMEIVAGTEKIVECDGVVLSVGLVPENEIAESLGIKIDSATRGPCVDQDLMTAMEGVFSCGNALHVNDMVDYVSEAGELAGRSAALYSKSKIPREIVPLEYMSKDFLYAVPQCINIKSPNKDAIFYFRSRDAVDNMRVQVKWGDVLLFSKKYLHLRPPEMERVEVNLKGIITSAGRPGIFMEQIRHSQEESL